MGVACCCCCCCCFSFSFLLAFNLEALGRDRLSGEILRRWDSGDGGGFLAQIQAITFHSGPSAGPCRLRI